MLSERERILLRALYCTCISRPCRLTVFTVTIALLLQKHHVFSVSLVMQGYAVWIRRLHSFCGSITHSRYQFCKGTPCGCKLHSFCMSTILLVCQIWYQGTSCDQVDRLCSAGTLYILWIRFCVRVCRLGTWAEQLQEFVLMNRAKPDRYVFCLGLRVMDRVKPDRCVYCLGLRVIDRGKPDRCIYCLRLRVSVPMRGLWTGR